jgi:hypothetical protein
MTKNTERQDRIERLMAQGYSRSEAYGRVYAREAGKQLLPATPSPSPPHGSRGPLRAP